MLQWSRRVNTAECSTEATAGGDTGALQWSRRVNTAECRQRRERRRVHDRASMEPPCEHGGVQSCDQPITIRVLLQWSRRVNTAECYPPARRRPRAQSFNGAAV